MGYEAFTVEGNEKQLEVLVGEAFGARVSLQASVNEYLSDHSPRRLIFSEEEGLSCILMLLYIIFTFFCLRRLCNRRGGMAPEKQKSPTVMPSLERLECTVLQGGRRSL